jgi:hypothetical protein
MKNIFLLIAGFLYGFVMYYKAPIEIPKKTVLTVAYHVHADENIWGMDFVNLDGITMEDVFWHPKYEDWFVNVSAYGATGDGSNETTEIQSAFDSGNNIEFGSSLNYRVASVLDVDQSGDQIFSGTDSGLYLTTSLDARLIVINKPSGTATFDGISIDGNDNVRGGWWVRSAFDIKNFEVRELEVATGNNGGAYGIYADRWNNVTYASSNIENGSFIDIKANSSDCSSAGGDGVSKGIFIVGNTAGATNTSNLTISNITVDFIDGDDGDGIDLFLFDNHETWAATVTVDGFTISNCQRRGMKLTQANITVKNGTINEPSSGSGLSCSGATNSLLSMFRTDSRDPGEPLNRNIRLQNIVFNSDASDWYGRGIIIYNSEEVYVEGCTFNGVEIDHTDEWGNTYLIGNTFTGNSFYRDYNVVSGWASGTGFSDTNNTKNQTGTWNQLSNQGTPQSSPVSCFDGIQNGDETGVDSGGSCDGTPAPPTGEGIVIKSRNIKINGGNVKVITD